MQTALHLEGCLDNVCSQKLAEQGLSAADYVFNGVAKFFHADAARSRCAKPLNAEAQSYCSQRIGGKFAGTLLLHRRCYRRGYRALTASREAVIYISMIRL